MTTGTKSLGQVAYEAWATTIRVDAEPRALANGRVTETAAAEAWKAAAFAVRAAVLAELSGSVPPMTMTAIHDAEIRSVPRLDDVWSLLDEIDALRAALAAEREAHELTREHAALDKEVMAASFEGLKERHAEETAALREAATRAAEFATVWTDGSEGDEDRAHARLCAALEKVPR